MIGSNFKCMSGLKPSVGATNSRVFPAFNPGKRLCFSSGNRPNVKKLSVFHTSLSSMSNE